MLGVFFVIVNSVAGCANVDADGVCSDVDREPSRGQSLHQRRVLSTKSTVDVNEHPDGVDTVVPATIREAEHDAEGPGSTASEPLHTFTAPDELPLPPHAEDVGDGDPCKQMVDEHGGVDGAGTAWMAEQCLTPEFREKCGDLCEDQPSRPPPSSDNNTAVLLGVATQGSWNCRASYGGCQCQSGSSCYYIGSSSSYCWTDGCGESSSGFNGRWCYCEEQAPAPSPSSTGSSNVASSVFTVTGSGCTASGRCVRSNYAPTYGNRESCTVSVSQSPLYVAQFQTERGFDFLHVNGASYSGSSNPGVIAKGTIGWTSDYSVVKGGWKVCKGCRCPSSHSYCYKTDGHCYYSLTSNSWSSTCAGSCTSSYVHEYKNFYNIGHMTNRISEVDWAITNGANAVEIDVGYADDGNNGAKPAWSWHGYPCDCSCGIGASGGVCWQMDSNCDKYENIDNMLAHLATTDLEMVELDNKVTTDYVGHTFKKKLTDAKKTQAGERIANKVIDKLLKKGFGGKVLVGGQSSMKFLKGAKAVFDANGYQDRVYYSVDGDDDGNGVSWENTKKALDTLGTDKLAFVNGISACSPKSDSNFLPGIREAKRAGIPIIIGWSIDYQSTAKTWIDAGVNGIITNFPDVIKSAAESKNLKA